MGQGKERVEPEREVEVMPPLIQPVPERRRRIYPDPSPLPVPPKNVVVQPSVIA